MCVTTFNATIQLFGFNIGDSSLKLESTISNVRGREFLASDLRANSKKARALCEPIHRCVFYLRSEENLFRIDLRVCLYFVNGTF